MMPISGGGAGPDADPRAGIVGMKTICTDPGEHARRCKGVRPGRGGALERDRVKLELAVILAQARIQGTRHVACPGFLLARETTFC
jgi:hypothetical protein